MNRLLTTVLTILIPLCVGATTVQEKPLVELVRMSDHAIVATVTKVEMVDAHGREIKDRKAMTGPGLENEILLHLEVKDVLFTGFDIPPKHVVVRLWKLWHFQLGEIQETQLGETSIFLLKGKDLEIVYPADFQRPMKELNQIKTLLKNQHRRPEKIKS